MIEDFVILLEEIHILTQQKIDPVAEIINNWDYKSNQTHNLFEQFCLGDFQGRLGEAMNAGFKLKSVE